MKSNELFREYFQKHNVKEIAEETGLSPSFIYKWLQPDGGKASGGLNPLERIVTLMRVTGDLVPLHWLCEQRGGYFVANPLPDRSPKSLSAAVFQVEVAYLTLLLAVANAAKDGHISPQAAIALRSLWETAKSVTEGFIQSCEQRLFA